MPSLLFYFLKILYMIFIEFYLFKLIYCKHFNTILYPHTDTRMCVYILVKHIILFYFQAVNLYFIL